MSRKLIAVAAVAALALSIAGCGKRSNDTGSDGGDPKTVTIGVLQGWAEDQVTTELWKQVLEKKGYTVNVKPLSDAGPMFTGVAGGSIDAFFDTWLPMTHKQYVDKYGSKMEDLGVWYQGDAKLTISVPKYVNINSIADLKGKGGTFNGEIIGIEPGAGLTAAAKKAIKGYGLGSEYKLHTSSTNTMLAELKTATSKHEPIVVTLWRPHWAYTQYPVKDLTDPKGLMGAQEKIHTYATKGFSKGHKEFAGWLKNFKMTDEQLGDLEFYAFKKYGQNQVEKGVTEWIKANSDFVKQMTA